MPRKTKELNEEKEIKKVTSDVTDVNLKDSKKTSSKTKKSATKENITKKSTKSSKLNTTNLDNDVLLDKENKSNGEKDLKNQSTGKKSVSKSTKLKTDNSKSKSSKTSTSKKNSNSRTTKSTKKSMAKSKTLNKNSKEEAFINNEYYDLPYRYNQTVVKVLAQTPNNLFIYWDISDRDRENLKKQYGEDFFETTYPVLIVYNDTLNYHFEVSINDFANSWYLHVNDSKSNYRIELGRRPIDYYKFNENVKNTNGNISNNIDYIKISTSNNIEAPNDRILFDKEQKMVYYKNVKTNVVKSKPITSLSFMHNIGKIYNVYELYKQIYKEENIEDLYDLSNPSSGNPSSNHPSSGSFNH